MNNTQFVISELHQSARLLEQLSNETVTDICALGDLLVERLSAGNKVMIFGNGGSAADAQHFASELVGRYRLDRAPLRALSLNTDTSIMTSISNDYGFSEVFSRQVRALASQGDVVIGLSTSGQSENVIAGLTAAREMKAHTVALIGSNNLGVCEIADLVICVPSDETARVQEAHGVIIHILCHIVEKTLTYSTDPQEAKEKPNP